MSTEEPQKVELDNMESKEPKKSKYIDDITYMMAWQNQCLTHYSWLMYQIASYEHAFAMKMQMDAFISQTQAHSTEQQEQDNNNNQPAQQQTVVLKLASIKSRIVAEAIDFLLIAFAKALVILYLYGNEYYELFEYLLVMDENMTITDLEWMLVQALLYRLVVVAYEGYCLSGTLPYSQGQTIGKKIMGIKALYCPNESIEDVDMETIRIAPKPIGVLRSCLRSVIKNMAISLMFPLLLPVLVFNHNKLVYDLVVDTIVVEKELPQDPNH